MWTPPFTAAVIFMVGGFMSASAQMLTLDCPSDCKYTATDNLLQCSCKNGTEISSSCYAQFGWYEKVETPCQFASSSTTEFDVQFWWNNYKDCGGATSDPCQYYNGTWLSTPFNQQQLIKPFAQTFFTVAGNAPAATSIWIEGSDVSGFGRLKVVPRL